MKLIVISIFLLLISSKAIAAEECNCGGDYQFVGPSFNVHGRLSLWNGNPSRRIWVIGTKRIIGIREETILPANLKSLLNSFDDEIYGDFVLCPITNFQKGVMQIVCIQFATKLIKKTK